jgi:hypothetical protein
MLPKPIRSWLSPFPFPTKGYREAAEPARPNNLLIDALFDIEKYAPTAGHYRCTCETVFWLPELLRWLVTHGRVEEAEATLDHIESGHGVAFQWLGERTIFRKN